MSVNNKKVAIIGAGVAGLASAIRLSAKGFDVTLYEKEEQAGGKMNQIVSEGFTFDVGPTIVMMPDVYKDVFKAAGKNPDDYMTMEQLNPIYSIYFPNEERIPVSTDLVDFTRFLENRSFEDAKGYFAYLSDIYARYVIAKEHFIERSFRSWKDFYNARTLIEALKLKTFGSAHNNIAKFVKDEQLQKLLSFQTLYIGISPRKGPSIYTIIPMIEMIYGVWFIKGGMYSLVKGMQRLASELNVNIRLGTEVQEIAVENKRVKGVVVDNQCVNYDIVLCNADFPYAMKHLVKDKKAKGKYTDKKIDKMEYSCSCMLMYLGIDEKLPDLDVHNIIFSNDFDGNIESIFSGSLTDDPSIYLYAPSKMDASLAPLGMEALYVLIPVPSLAHGYTDWGKEAVENYKDIVFSKMESVKGLEGIRNKIVTETVYTPKDFESRFHAYQGATFGLAPTLLQSNYFRPQCKAPCEGLYFTGSSVHPGAGVPIVLTSAKLAVAEIERDMEIS